MSSNLLHGAVGKPAAVENDLGMLQGTIVPDKRFSIVLMHPSIDSLLRVRGLGKNFNLKERIHSVNENWQKFQRSSLQ